MANLIALVKKILKDNEGVMGSLDARQVVTFIYHGGERLVMRHGVTELLYLEDSYLREFEARVERVVEDSILLDRTIFHPTGGGLVSDVGVIHHEGGSAEVVEAKFVEGGVLHVLKGRCPMEGEVIRGAIDWERRYSVMQMHTALHALSAVVVREAGALVTGNQVRPDVSRVDFSLNKLDRAEFEKFVEITNYLLADGRDVRIRWMRREEVLAIPNITKLANRLPPDLPVLRIVEIDGVDVQADGGPHVKNTRECGRIEIVDIESKGARNKRLYFTLRPLL